MKIVCLKSVLTEAVNGVSKAVTARSTIPVLEGILLKTDGNHVVLTGYDLEMGITTSIDAQVLEPGEIVLSAKLFGDMVRRLDSDTIEIVSNAETLNTTIKGGITEFDIMGMNSMDYPEMPAPGADPAFTIAGDTLQEMISTTLFAVSQDDKKPAHTGELFVLENSALTLVALDGFRLAICERPVIASREIRIIIPAKTLNEVNKLIGDGNPDVSISANRRYVVFAFDGYTIMSRLLEGEFLDYKKVIPDGYTSRITVETKGFINSIERASLIITERLKNPLRVLFETGKVVVRCQTALGKVIDEFEAETEGDKVEIGFNNRYLLDALRNCGRDKVVFEINGPLSPIKVLPSDGTDFIFLVLPVRFKND